MKSKKKVITLVAVLTAIIGAAVAIGAFLKRNAKVIGEKLDYDGNLYYEDDTLDDYDAVPEDPADELNEESSSEPVDVL